MILSKCVLIVRMKIVFCLDVVVVWFSEDDGSK